MRNKKNAFTLIELVAVLVIMAIIALIVTPLVMNIVKKAKDSANKKSVDGYGKAVELAIATHLLDTGDYPETLDNLKVEYTGNEVICNVKTLNEDGSIYLSECRVKGTEVKDNNTEDGWYHYGKLISNEITYKAYNIGDVVTYNGMDFYVIENSDESSDRVTMLKAEPLTVDEVNTYGGVGTLNNHVNMYTRSYSSYQTAYDSNGYGGMQYYSSKTCGYVTDEIWSEDGCIVDYEKSEVKYVVDAWATDKFLNGILVEDETGYSTRLITYEELTTNLGYEKNSEYPIYPSTNGHTPSWLYSNSYHYWTMTATELNATGVWIIYSSGNIESDRVEDEYPVVRPVVTILKSAI